MAELLLPQQRLALRSDVQEPAKSAMTAGSGQCACPQTEVKPDGAPFIEVLRLLLHLSSVTSQVCDFCGKAFPLGVVLNYCLGLVCSRATRLWSEASATLLALLLLW